LILAALTCLSLGACASTDIQDSPVCEPPKFAQPFNRPPEALPEEQVKPAFGTYNPAASTVFPDYTLNIGDVLEVIYHVRTGVSADKYRLKVQDVISIRFPFQKSLDQDVTVQSDGTIRLLLVGEIKVVKRGEHGISKYHFRQLANSRGFSRFNPDTNQWDPYPYQIERSADGGWLKRDPATGIESRLEADFPVDDSGRVTEPFIVDLIGPAGRGERFEYDHVQLRWKSRPSYVEQVGLSAEELKDLLTEQYARFLRDPELTVTVKQANIKIDELKKAITTAPRGQSRLMPVKPDGTVDLPFVGEVMAFGKTIQQLKTDIEAAYAQVDLPEISVTVQMNQWAPHKIFVVGEVNTPGLLSVQTPMTLLQALAAAGGINKRACADQILVIRRKGLPVPEATVMSLWSLINKDNKAKAGEMPDFSNLRYDFYLSDMDIVYVPSSALAVTGDWVELVFTRIVYGIMPHTFYTGLNFGYQLHNEPTTIKTHRGKLPNVNMQLGP